MARSSAQFNSGNIAALLILAATSLFTNQSYAVEVLIDRVLGSVNGEPILYSDVSSKITTGPLVVVSEFPATEQSPPFERALNDRINFELILQKSRELDLDIDDAEVESQISEFLSSKGLDRASLRRFLSQENKTYEQYKDDFRNQLVLGRFQRRVIAPLVKVTDRDLETAYLRTTGTTSDLVEVVLRKIVITIPDGSGSVIAEAKRSQARDARTKIESGFPFENAVKLYSDDPSKEESGGKMEPVRMKDLAPVILKEVERLDIGGITAPIEIGSSIYLFKVEDRKVSLGKNMEQKRAELEAELRNAELANQLRRWLSEQRQRSKIEIIVK